MMKLLIVEDDFTNRKLLVNLIKEYYDVICDTASDGLEGVKAFQSAWDENTPYDLIFMDIMMPNLDGMGALELIRQMEKQNRKINGKHAEIYMTTALDNEKVRRDAYNLGCNGFFAKPIDFNLVITELDRFK